MDIFSLEEEDSNVFITQDSYRENVEKLADLVDDEVDIPLSQVVNEGKAGMQFSDISDEEAMETDNIDATSAPIFE